MLIGYALLETPDGLMLGTYVKFGPYADVAKDFSLAARVMKRINPTPVQKERLLKANAFRCCVCKRTNIGFNFHHIDGNPRNTVDTNLAVLCVEDHDQHHRPLKYAAEPNHLNLNSEELIGFKTSWEAFVAEAQRPSPRVLATLSCYGTEDLIHSLQLVMQWPDGRIEYNKSYHLLDGNLDRLTDQIFDELAAVAPKIKMALVNEPLPVEHCPCCGKGFSRIMYEAVVVRLTDPEWAVRSVCSIYLNPVEPTLAISFFLGERHIISGQLHLCCGTMLHYSCESVNERIPVRPRPSVRTQATNIVSSVLRSWRPAKVLIGTGNPDKPVIICDDASEAGSNLFIRSLARGKITLVFQCGRCG